MFKSTKYNYISFFICFLVSFLTITDAHAYIGPGAGITAIGSFIALVLAVLVALVGFIWFPIKRYFKKKKQQSLDEEDD